MKLLFDENISDKIIGAIHSRYPECLHVKILGLLRAKDSEIWDYACQHGMVIVSKDADFHQRSLVFGHPPKLIFLKCGNSPTSEITRLLIENYGTVEKFIKDSKTGILILS